MPGADVNLRLCIEYVAVESLAPAARNARTHSRRQETQLAGSIASFGFIVPIIVDAAGAIVAGHGRVAAAKQAGLATVPIIRVEHLTPDQLRAYALADNKIAANAGWDETVLKIEIAELLQVGVDLRVTGFETGEIDRLMTACDFSIEDAADAFQGEVDDAEPLVSRLGDIWELGQHKLACGDMRDDAVWARLMGAERARMSFSDPPYNVRIGGNVSTGPKPKHGEFAMASGEMSSEDYRDFLTAACRRTAAHAVDGALHFVCIDWRHLDDVDAVGRAVFAELKALCVWDKQSGGMGSLYRSRHELIAVFKQGTAPHINNIELGRHGRNRTNIWSYPGASTFGRGRQAALDVHPTVKPTALVADAILDVSNRNDLVIDPFAGSGTTILAAERTGRRARAVEIAPAYVDAAVRRWRQMTGGEARLAGSRQSFAEAAEGAAAHFAGGGAPQADGKGECGDAQEA